MWPRTDPAALAVNDQLKQYSESLRNQKYRLDCFSCNYIAKLLLWGEFNLYILADMSVLKRVRENFGGAALGGALALSPAAVQAQEVDYQPPQCEMIEGTHGVPISDQRDMRQEVVRTITARSSRDGISLAVYGDDASVLKDAAQALYDAHKCGLPVIGVVLGSPDEESGVDVYVSGFPTATYEQEHIEAARRLGPQKLHEHLLASIERAESLREELRLTTDAKDTASADSVRTASMNLSQ